MLPAEVQTGHIPSITHKMDEKEISKSSGFTLIELIVVFSVISILSTLGVAAFVDYSRTQALQTSTNDFVNTLNLAKGRALSQVKPSECTQEALSGYRVEILDKSTYKLSVVCTNTYKVSQFSLPTNITFNMVKITTPIFFPIISSGVAGYGNTEMTAYGKSRCVTVSSGGIILQTTAACP